MNSNKNQFSNETSMSLKDLFWSLLEQWKAIALFSVCLTALFITLMHLNNLQDIKRENEAQKVNNVSEQELISSLPETDQAAVETVYRLSQERERLRGYIKSAPIMQIDPHHAKCLRASWNIDADDEYAQSVCMSYVTNFQTDKNIEALESATGGENSIDQFRELVWLNLPNQTSQDTVAFTIFLTDDMSTDTLNEVVRQIVDETHDQLVNEYGEHEIKDYKSEITTISDDNLFTKQITVLNTMFNTSNQINNLRNTFSSEQKGVYAQLESKNNQQEVPEQVSKPNKVLTFRNIIIGLVLSAIIYVFLYFLLIMVTNKVLSSNALKGTSVRTLGQWYSCAYVNNSFKLARDKSIWKRHHRGFLDMNTEVVRITESVKNICRHQDIHNIIIALTEETTSHHMEFIKSLIEKVSTNNLDVQLVYTDSGSLNESVLVDAEGLVLIVVESKTRFKDLETVFDRCNEYEIPILGSVYLG